MELFSTVNGQKEHLKAWVLVNTQIMLGTLEIGSMGSHLVKELKSCQMVLNTLATGFLVKQMAKVLRCCLMAQSTKGSGTTDRSSMGSVNTLTARFTKVNGKKVNHMVRELNIGLMGGGMMGNGVQANLLVRARKYIQMGNSN